MGKTWLARSFAALAGVVGVNYVVMAIQKAFGGSLEDGINYSLLAITLFFVGFAVSRLFLADAALLPGQTAREYRLTSPAPRERHLAFGADASALFLILLGLAVTILVTVFTTTYVAYQASPTYSNSDAYRYINMSFTHGEARYVYQPPYCYRVLVPFIVHLLTQIGVPFQDGFFSLTCVTLVISAIALYFLARGAGVSRFGSSFTSLCFTMLIWTVTYNVRDYYLVDTTTQAFIICMLLAAQRRLYPVAIVLGTIGAACKETTFLAIAFVAVQLFVPAWMPLSSLLWQAAHLRVRNIVTRIAPLHWLYLGLLVGGPLLVVALLHHFITPLPSPSLRTVWKGNIGDHVRYGIEATIGASTWYAFGILFFLALGALVLRLWSRAHWSGWSIFVALLIIVFGYAFSKDNARVSIYGWPFVLILAALMLQEISRRFLVTEKMLWPVTFFLLLLNLPPSFSQQGMGGATNVGNLLLTPVLPWQAQSLLLFGVILGLLILTAFMARTQSDAKQPNQDVSLQEAETLRRVAISSRV